MCVLHAEQPLGPFQHADQAMTVAVTTKGINAAGTSVFDEGTQQYGDNPTSGATITPTELNKHARMDSGRVVACAALTTRGMSDVATATTAGRKLEIWERPIDWNGDGGCCSHSNSQEDCRRATCCLHGLAKCEQAASNATRTGMRPMRKITHSELLPKEVDLPLIHVTRAARAPRSEPAPKMDASMLVPGPTRFIPQLGCLAQVNGQQCILFRGFEPIAAPPQVHPHGLLAALTEDRYLLARANEDIVCLIVPATGGVYTTNRGQTLALHPLYPVRPMQVTRACEYAKVEKYDVEVAGNENMVKMLVAFYECLSAIGMQSSAHETRYMAAELPNSKNILLATSGGMLNVTRRIAKYAWVPRHITQNFLPMQDVLAGLCDLINAEIGIPRSLAQTPCARDLLVVDIRTLPLLHTLGRCFSPCMFSMLDVEQIRPVKFRPGHGSAISMSTQTTAVESVVSLGVGLVPIHAHENVIEGAGDADAENGLEQSTKEVLLQSMSRERDDDTSASSLVKPEKESRMWGKVKIGWGIRRAMRKAGGLFHRGKA